MPSLVVSSSVIPWPVARQAPLPLGFSRQEYWSRLPCPPPGDLPNPGLEPRSPALRADSLLSELSGKPKNTGVGSLSLLQGIFPIQESTQGFLHCRWILYQLSYQSSPQNCYINWVHARIWLFSHHLTTFSKSSYTVLVIAASCSS